MNICFPNIIYKKIIPPQIMQIHTLIGKTSPVHITDQAIVRYSHILGSCIMVLRGCIPYIKAAAFLCCRHSVPAMDGGGGAGSMEFLQ